MEYTDRFYRQSFRQVDLVYFPVVIEETDLMIGVGKEHFSGALAAFAEETVRDARKPLEAYARKDPAFVRTLAPYTPMQEAPEIVRCMALAGSQAGVGPMAAVAGAIADILGDALSAHSPDVIVENGGDIYLRTSQSRRVGIFAGESPLSGRVGLEILPEDGPMGICTSSGKVGHGLSFGQADAAVILSPSTALADAVATACGNLVQTAEDIEQALAFACGIPDVLGALVIADGQLGVRGKLRLIPMK